MMGAIFVAMLIGLYLDQKYGKGPRFGMLGGFLLAVGIAVFLGMIWDLSFAEIVLKEEGISQTRFGATVGTALWRYSDMNSFDFVSSATLRKSFSLLVLQFGRDEIIMLGVPKRVSVQDIGEFLRARGVQEKSQKEQTKGVMAHGPGGDRSEEVKVGKSPKTLAVAGTRRVTWRQKLGVLLFTVTVPILAMDYWQNGGRLTFFGAVPLGTLGTIASCGGAISFLLYSKTREWGWAWMPGLLAGFGGFYLHIAYTIWFEKQEMWNMESVLIALLGAAPGMLMYAGVSKILRPKEKANIIG